MYTIEKNIPLETRERSELYKTMNIMEVWDSFLMETFQEASRARNVFIRWMKFSVKKAEGWYRCWRKL